MFLHEGRILELLDKLICSVHSVYPPKSKMTHCEGFSLWNSRNAKLLIPRNLSWQEIKNMCLVDFTLIWSHRCDFPEIISSLKSILKEFLVPTLNLETRWCWSWINKCKRRLLSSASEVLIRLTWLIHASFLPSKWNLF